MAELDTDLYGDLYGADDNDFASATETAQDLSKLDSNEPDDSEEPLSPPKPAESMSKPPPKLELVQQPSTVLKLEPSPPPTQQIPTYQQQTPDYNQVPTSRADDYQNMNRPVRPSEMKEEGKMFIGGLNWDTTDGILVYAACQLAHPGAKVAISEGLRNYFSQFGKVEACTIMRDAGGRSRCFAFLTFEDPASVNAVMVREHFLDGKIIDPKRAIPRQEHQRATKLFIGGLAGSVTSESMREFFSQFGRVVDSTVMLDRETGRSKGFGFVSLENADVDSILGFGKLQIDGKLIDVKLAQPRSARDGTSNPGADGGNTSFSGNTGGFGGQGQFGNVGTMQNATGSGNTPFDANALASLWTRMFQQMGGVNPMMGGGAMNPMMAAGMGAGNMGMGMGMGNMGGMGRGGPMQGMGNMGMQQGPNAATLAAMGRGMNPNIPRGPRGAPGTGPGAGSGTGVGPQRTGQRSQHGYHPYSR